VDGIVIATFEKPDRLLAELGRMGIPEQKFLTLRRPATSPANGNGSDGTPRGARRS